MGQAPPEVQEAADDVTGTGARRTGRRGRARPVVLPGERCPRLGRHRPRRHAAPHRRHRHRPHPRGARRARRAAAYRRLHHRAADALDGAAVARTVGGHGLAICSNGGIVYDVAGRAVRSRADHPRRRSARRSARHLRTEIPGSTFALEKTTGFAREHDFMPRLRGHAVPDVPTGPLEEISDDTVVKLLALHPEMAPEDYWAARRAGRRRRGSRPPGPRSAPSSR